MSQPSNRLNLRIDIFDLEEQLAQPLATLTAAQLITGILKEFQKSFNYLGIDGEQYQLLRIADRKKLVPNKPLREQVQENDHLVLGEVEESVPNGATSPTEDVYLREKKTGHVYKLQWFPALIGRPGSAHEDSMPLAVNLEHFPAGPKVSRRQAKIVQKEGGYAICNLSTNPITLFSTQKNEHVEVESDGEMLGHNDQITLERSAIQLEFLVRAEETMATHVLLDEQANVLVE